MFPTLYLVRHGVTQPNIDGIISGGKDEISLTSAGVDQCRESGEWLQGKGIKKIFSSPMLRVRQTVEGLGLNVPVVFDERLREMDYGIFEGKPSANLPEQFRWKNWFSYKELPRTGGESILDAQKRLNDFMQECLMIEKLDTVAVVAHGGSLRVLLSVLCPHLEERVRHEHTGNAEVWCVKGGNYEKVFSPLMAR